MKIYNCRGTFFEKGKDGGGGCGGAPLTKANVSGVGTGEMGGWQGGRVLSEISNFDRKYLLNAGIQKNKRTLLVMLLSFFIHNSYLTYPGIYT